MRVTIRYFAVLREAAGRSAEERVLSPGTSVGDLLDRLAEDYPIVDRLRAYSRVMVNQEYVPLDHPLSDGDEFVIIPPVSGGAGPFRVVQEPIDPDEVTAAVAAPDAGAIVTFQGTVRDNARGRRVLYLEYDAYPAAAEKTLAQIGDEIRERWGIDRVAITHRIGRVEIGEPSVVIAVASPHRAEAFDACRYAIDRIKEIVPIWKKEAYEGGETWIGSEAAYQEQFGHSTSRK